MNRELFNDLVEIVVPYVESPAERAALLNLALYEDAIVKQINTNVAPINFAQDLVFKCHRYGKLSGHVLAVVAVLDHIRKNTGENKQVEIDKLSYAYRHSLGEEIAPVDGVRILEGEPRETVTPLPQPSKNDELPNDYYYLNHTSFLRHEKQEEFRARTGVRRNHYDIHVIVDSFYNGALERVEKVEYYLHRAYPHSIQVRTDYRDKFLLKELANGEYVLQAKVYVKEKADFVRLQRYISLWESGPRLRL